MKKLTCNSVQSINVECDQSEQIKTYTVLNTKYQNC